MHLLACCKPLKGVTGCRFVLPQADVLVIEEEVLILRILNCNNVSNYCSKGNLISILKRELRLCGKKQCNDVVVMLGLHHTLIAS